MKKLMMITLCSLVSCIFAHEIQDIEQKKEEIHAITYKITLYHEQEYDKTQWQKTVDEVVNVIQKGKQGASAEEMITAFVRGIKVLCEKDDAKSGIHGEMKVSMSDGVKDQKKCGDMCPCITKYKGVCPCTMEDSCGAQIRATCNEQCQKTGCSPEACAQNGCVKSCTK